MAELLRRRLIPSGVIALSTVDVPARARAAVRRAAHGRGRVELYFAFDDPCSAVALIDLTERLAGRQVDLVTLPVVQRGIPGDPAVSDKRRYAVEDARRLSRRSGLVLSRTQPLDPLDTAFLAEWVAASPPGPDVSAFCVGALKALWFDGDGPVEQEELAARWRGLVGPLPDAGASAVGRNERRMRRRGPYDTPAAVIGRRWYFAHDRLVQIAERLDELGWRLGS